MPYSKISLYISSILIAFYGINFRSCLANDFDDFTKSALADVSNFTNSRANEISKFIDSSIISKFCNPGGGDILCQNNGNNKLLCKGGIKYDDKSALQQELNEYCSAELQNGTHQRTNNARSSSQITGPISIHVVDDEGEPLMASVRYFDSANTFIGGVNADIDGNAQITNTDKIAKIEISSIGMKTETISGATLASGNINVNMKPDAKILAEVETIGCAPTNGKNNVAKTDYNKDTKVCDPIECVSARYKLVGTSPNIKCEDQNGKDCPSSDSNVKKSKYEWKNNSLLCVIKTCKKGFMPSDDGTRCEISEGPCNDTQLKAVENATKGELKKGVCKATECAAGYEVEKGKCIAISGNCKPMPEHATKANRQFIDGSEKCIIEECADGYKVSDDGTSCIDVSPKLSEADSKAKVDALRDNARQMKEKEQSDANKALGAAAIGTTAIGGMNLASGMAEQSADSDAEEDMKAYLATFVCDYGQGRNHRGGETNIDLPGGNALIAETNEYRTLAADLKIRKEALGLRPGIEFETIFDIAETGLYDNVSLGKTDGVYTSLSRALSDENSADAAAWEKQKADTSNKVKTAIATVGVATAGAVAANLAINSKNKNQSDKIIDDFEKKKQVFDNLQQEADQLPVTRKCSDYAGAYGTYDNCKCNDTKLIFNADEGCVPCPGNKIHDGNNQCICPPEFPVEPTATNTNCTAAKTNCRLTGLVGENCTCRANATAGTNNQCVCNNGYNEHLGTCIPNPVMPSISTPNVQTRNLDQLPKTLSISLSADTFFDTGKHTLNNQGTEFLQSFRDKLNAAQQAAGITNDDLATYNICIVGHTDRKPFRGDKANQKNYQLSQNRANTVKTLLQNNGFTQSIETSGKGPDECIKSLYPNAGDQKCRKVTVSFTTENCQTIFNPSATETTNTAPTASVASPVATAALNNNTFTGITDQEFRNAAPKFVSACENYNNNGTIGKFVVSNDIYKNNLTNSMYQKAYCIFLKPSANLSGTNDPLIATSNQSYQNDLIKYAQPGYIFAPDNDAGLRCKELFSNIDESFSLFQGSAIPTGSNGNFTGCEFLYYDRTI